MTRKRLTREQSKDQTRQRLIEAAQKIFTKKGYVASSVEDIAEAAGYTRGAFYSNFSSKSELLMELLQRDHERMQVDMQSVMAGEVSPEEMKARAVDVYSRICSDGEYFLIWVEAKLLASRDAKFRGRFNAFIREKQPYIAQFIEAFCAQVGTPLPMPADMLAFGFMSLCDGAQFFHMSDPQQVTDTFTGSVLGAFLTRVMFG